MNTETERSRSKDLMVQQQLPSDIERAQSQCKDSSRLTLDQFLAGIRSEMGMPQKSPTLPSMQFHSADNDGNKKFSIQYKKF